MFDGRRMIKVAWGSWGSWGSSSGEVDHGKVKGPESVASVRQSESLNRTKLLCVH